MHMPEVGCQTGGPLLDIQALAVPPQQGADGESVPQIMQARAPRIRPPPEVDLPEQLHERRLQRVLHDPSAPLGEEVGRIEGMRAETVALQRGVRQGQPGGLVNGKAAGLAELGVSDRQHAADEIDIVPVKAQRLGRAHPGDSQERQERGTRAGPQAGASAEPLRRTDQVGDLLCTVDIRSCATMPGREQSLRAKVLNSPVSDVGRTLWYLRPTAWFTDLATI